MSQNQPQRVEVTLFEEQEGAPTMAAEHAGWWNGFAVPRVTAQTVIDYWAACRAHDPNGEWSVPPFVDDAGHLRIPSANDPGDREEDYVYRPNDDGTFDVDGLVWSVVSPAYVVNLPGSPDEFASAREAWVCMCGRSSPSSGPWPWSTSSRRRSRHGRRGSRGRASPSPTSMRCTVA